jgi:plasmid stabilization system protein ParE
MAYRVSPAARRDLDDILSWYRDEGGPSIARRMRDQFHAFFRQLGRPPFAQVRRVDLLPDPYRLALMDPYWVVCLPQGKRTVWIVRVLHARRDVARLLAVLR